MASFESKKIVVFGNDGQVSRSLQILVPHARYVTRSECDFTRPEGIRPLLDRLEPELIINPAAFTEVDRAETDFELAHTINAVAPGEIGKWCAEHGASLIHYSTDYIYSGEGERPWQESDGAHPVNKYGLSKWQGEASVCESGCHHVILRTSWVYSPFGKNFLLTMIRLGRERDALRVVNDQVGAPTYAADLAFATLQICKHPRFKMSTGAFHVVNAGEASWFEFASEIFKKMRQRGEPLRVRELLPISSSEYPVPAARPKNSRLNANKLYEQFGLRLRDWRSALEDCLLTLS